MAIEDAVTTQHTEWVSARELSRRTSELLDHVAAGAAVMICRHGRPVAALSPLPGAPLRRAVARSPDQASNTKTPLTQEEEDQLHALDVVQRTVLGAMSDGCTPDQIAAKVKEHEPAEIAVALGRLEIARLIVKEFGGYSLTIRGERLARALGQRSG
jgi:prevent-host-death family protein